MARRSLPQTYHTKGFGKGDATIRPASWFFTILPRSPMVANITEQNKLSLYVLKSFWCPKINLEVLWAEIINFTSKKKI